MIFDSNSDTDPRKEYPNCRLAAIIEDPLEVNVSVEI